MNIQNTEIMQKQYMLYRKKRFLAIVIALIMISMVFSGCRLENVNALTEEVEMTTTPEDTSQDREFDTEQTAEPSQTPQLTNEQENTPEATDEITETQESYQEPEETTAVIEETLSPETTEEITALISEETTTEADVTPSPIPEPTSTTEPEATPSSEMTEQSTVELTEEAEATTEPVATEETTPEPTEEVPDAACSGADTNEYTIVSFIYEPMSYVVERGVPEEDLPLPETLSAVNGNGETITVPVTWKNGNEDVDDYLKNKGRYEFERLMGYGPWTFTAVAGEAYTYSGEDVIATVSIPECKVVQSFCGFEEGSLLMKFIVYEGEEVNLPTQLLGYMEDGGYKSVPVTWSGSYDTNTVGTYTLTMNLSSGYSGGSASLEIVVESAQ